MKPRPLRFACAAASLGVAAALAAPCDAPPAAVADAQCRRQVAELNARIETALRAYTELHPEVRALRRELADLGSCASPAEADAGARVVEAQALVTVDPARSLQALHGFGGTHALSVLQPDRMSDDQWRRVLGRLAGDIGAFAGEGPPSVEAPPDAAAGGTGFSRPLDFRGLQTLFRRYGAFSPEGVGDMHPFASLNVRWIHPWLRDLRARDYERYLDELAAKAVATVAEWKRLAGREPELLQLWNEPTSGNGEMAGATPRELADIVKRAGAALRKAGHARVKFLVPNEETVAATMASMRAIASDPEALGYVGAIGYHAYPYDSEYSYVPRLLATRAQGRDFDAPRRERLELRALGGSLGLPLWMTEVWGGYMRRGSVRESPVPDSIDWIIGRSIHIHDELRDAGASAYFGMMVIASEAIERDATPGVATRNLRGEGDSLILVELATDQVTLTAAGHAIGHFGRWLRRGARYLAGDSSSPHVLASPFLDRGRLVVVLVNTARTPIRTTLRLASGEFAAVAGGDQTRTGICLAALAPVEPKEGALEVELPAWSVTTVAVPVR